MKTYTLVLDICIMCMLILAIQFWLSDSSVSRSTVSHRGVIRTMIVSWQTLFFVASFCVLLRYLARNLDRIS